MSSPVKRVSEVAGQSLEGAYVHVRDVVDKDILITTVIPMTTEYGDAIGVQFTDPDTFEPMYFITSTTVLMRKLLKCLEEDAFPLQAKVTRPPNKQYYDIN